MEREKLGSRLGFILLSAGCAIGIGNVWKFPYIAGQNGGGIFVLIYIFFLIIFGVPVLTMEFSVGRASQRSVTRMYQEIEPKNTKWHIHGYAALIGNVILMMFYTVVAGWMLKYFVSMATGDLEGMNSNQVATYFDDMLLEPGTQVIYMAIIVVIGFLVCSIGLQNGLEKVTKVMMIALLIVMIMLAGNSILTDGGALGLKFYLMPDLDRMQEVGIGNVIVAAMNQAFFTLSLGLGAMAIFGSYIEKKRSLMGEAVNVALLDTFVAITSGLIIFPACFAYGVEPDSGPSLVFITLPNIFNNMEFGRVWGSLFFIFMSFASISTVLTVFEGILSGVMEMFNIGRKKACLICGVLMFVLSLPCALGFNVLSAITPFGEGSTIMDLEDFIVSNIMLPLGSLVFVLFCVTKRGWTFEKFKEEANIGKGIKVKNWMYYYMKYVLPVLILVLFVMGIYNFFAG